MQIGVTKEEFEVHLQSVKHQRNKDIRDLSSLSSSAETVFSAPSQPLETINNFQRKCDENHNGLLSDAANDNDEGTCQSTALSENNIISVMRTTSKRNDDVLKNTTINGLLLERILEETVAFIETNIPFADPVNSGILENIELRK